MKKKLIIIVSSVLVVLATAGIILGVTLSNRNKDNTPEPDISKGELSVPRGLVLTGTVLSWDQVDNATSYVVYVGDEPFETTECSLDLSGKAKERDVLCVTSVAAGYKTSNKSIEKVFITTIDEEEVSSMSSTVTDFMSEVLGDSKLAVELKYGDLIETVTTSLYKEGLVTSDIEQIVTTIDDVANSIAEFDPDENTTQGDYVKLVTDQVSKLLDLNVSSYATVVAIKEIVVLTTDTLNPFPSYKKMLFRVEEYVSPQLQILIKLGEYFESMSNRDIERIAFVLDSLKEMYEALEEKLPTLFDEIDNLTEEFNASEVTVDTYLDKVESLVKIKDAIVASVIEGLPTMEEYTEVMSIFGNIYTILAPEYIEAENICNLLMSEFQHTYAFMHKAICFVGEMDIEVYLAVTPYIENIATIIDEDILSYFEPSTDPNVDMRPVIYAILEDSGLTEEEVKALLSGINSLITDVTENTEEFAQNLSMVIIEAMGKHFEGADFTVITEDPLVLKIVEIANSEDTDAALRKFLSEDIHIEKYLSYKEGKTIEDVVYALKNVTLADIINYMSQEPQFTQEEILSLLGLEDVVTINIKGLFKEIYNFADVELIALVNDIILIEEYSDIEAICLEYFKFELDIEALFDEVLDTFLAEYNLNVDYETIINNVIKTLGLDQIYENVVSIYNTLSNAVISFEENYVPLVPTIESPSLDVLEDYGMKYLTYVLFQEDSEQALVDLENIYNKIIALKENDEIVDIFDNFILLFEEFDVTISFDDYMNNEELKEEFTNEIKSLITNVIGEINNGYDWMMGLEIEFSDIANLVDKFLDEYFELEIDVKYYIEYLFDILETIKLPEGLDETLVNMFDDLVIIFDEIIALEEQNEIVLIVDEIVVLIEDYFASFDMYLFETDETYREEMINDMITLANNVIDKAYEAALWGASLEEVLLGISDLVDNFGLEYFGQSFFLSDEIKYFFEGYNMNLYTEDEIAQLKEKIEQYITESAEEVIVLIADINENTSMVLSSIMLNYDENVEVLDEALFALGNKLGITLTLEDLCWVFLQITVIGYDYTDRLVYVLNTCMDEFKEVVMVVKDILTIEEIDGVDYVALLSDNLVELCNLFNIECEITLSNLYDDLHGLFDLILNVDEITLDELEETLKPVEPEIIPDYYI